jgi:ribonuclease P/MRP protein subunit RPP40
MVNGQIPNIKYQMVKYHNVETGVPQGSTLGPLLFLVYMNDIVDNIQCDINLFADDTSLLQRIDDPVLSTEKINIDLRTLTAWASQWLMTFNVQKTILMTFSYRKLNELPSVFFGGVQLPEAKQHTHLGLTLSNNMSWDAHVDRVCTKVGRLNNILRRLKFVLPRTSIDTLFKVKVRPAIEYANVLYDSCTRKLANKLERLQLESARTCTGGLRHTNTIKLLKEVGWEPLFVRRQWQKLMLFYKMINNMVPAYLNSLCPPRVSTISRYRLRNSDSLQLIRCRTSRYKNSFIPSTVKSWNNLDPVLRNKPTINSFKSNLLAQNAYPKPPSHFSHGNRTEAIHHTRMRLGASTLNFDLFARGLCTTPECDCGNPRETTCHFLLYCPLFDVQRHRLLLHVRDVIAPGTNPTLLFNMNVNRYLDILLSGSVDLDTDNNSLIFNAVQNFIAESARF